MTPERLAQIEAHLTKHKTIASAMVWEMLEALRALIGARTK